MSSPGVWIAVMDLKYLQCKLALKIVKLSSDESKDSLKKSLEVFVFICLWMNIFWNIILSSYDFIQTMFEILHRVLCTSVSYSLQRVGRHLHKHTSDTEYVHKSLYFKHEWTASNSRMYWWYAGRCVGKYASYNN